MFDRSVIRFQESGVSPAPGCAGLSIGENRVPDIVIVVVVSSLAVARQSESPRSGRDSLATGVNP